MEEHELMRLEDLLFLWNKVEREIASSGHNMLDLHSIQRLCKSYYNLMLEKHNESKS